MKTLARFGVRWPDGGETGPITDRASWAAAYAREHGGQVLDYVRVRLAAENAQNRPEIGCKSIFDGLETT